MTSNGKQGLSSMLVGSGTVLTQMTPSDEFFPDAFACRALSDVEKRYSHTEKEALAVLWEIEHFNIYLLGIHFELVTDKKPLEKIYSATSKPPARIEKWVLHLAPYNFTVIYRPGSTNLANLLSRLLLLSRCLPMTAQKVTSTCWRQLYQLYIHMTR